VTKYIIRRLIYLVPVVFGVSLITFLLMRVVPGDVAVVALGTNATEESLAEFRHAYDLDEPLFDYRPPFGQYGDWVGGFFTGDFGKSYFSRSPVRDELAHRLPVTLQLAIMSLFLTLVPAIPAGVIAAVRPNSLIDLVTRTTAVFGLSIPVFWLGTLFILLPAILLILSVWGAYKRGKSLGLASVLIAYVAGLSILVALWTSLVLLLAAIVTGYLATGRRW